MQYRKQLLETLSGLLEVCPGETHPDLAAHSSDPAVILAFEYEGLPLRVLHAEVPAHLINHALIECNMGPAAPDNKEAQYEQLLDLNYRLSATNTAFAVDAQSADILFTCAIVVDSTDTDALIQVLEGMHTTYAQWLLTGLKDEAPEEATGIRPDFLRA